MKRRLSLSRRKRLARCFSLAESNFQQQATSSGAANREHCQTSTAWRSVLTTIFIGTAPANRPNRTNHRDAYGYTAGDEYLPASEVRANTDPFPLLGTGPCTGSWSVGPPVRFQPLSSAIQSRPNSSQLAPFRCCIWLGGSGVFALAVSGLQCICRNRRCRSGKVSSSDFLVRFQERSAIKEHAAARANRIKLRSSCQSIEEPCKSSFEVSPILESPTFALFGLAVSLGFA
jgi:hypothetical protein